MMSNRQTSSPRLAVVMAIAAIGNISIGATTSQPLVAFPGAVGQGAASVGGRGGDVYHVSNLSDYDEGKGEAKISGSLRHAIRSAKGARTIVFDVGGAIKLHGPLKISKSNLTIAGQTAPGGITVWGYPTEVSNAKDVVIRHVRFRTGDFNARPPKGGPTAGGASEGKGSKDLDAASGNCLGVGQSDRVILDHISALWGMDETLSVTKSRNVTVQNTIVAQSLNRSYHPKGPHGYGTLIRGELTPADQEAGQGGYTFYGNLWAFHRARNPSIGGQQHLASEQDEIARRSTDVNLVNNVVYGWSDQPTHRSEFGAVRINLIGNYYICGPMKKADYIFKEAFPATTSLFYQDNFLDADQDASHNGKPVGTADDVGRSFRQFGPEDSLLGPVEGKPFNFIAAVASRVLPAADAYQKVIRQAGASLSRDAIETDIVKAVTQRTGSIIDSQETFRGGDGKLPGIDDVPTIVRPADFDTDRDGMSDVFEREHGLDRQNPADQNGRNLSEDGYTNLEVYLNSLVPDDRGM